MFHEWTTQNEKANKRFQTEQTLFPDSESRESALAGYSVFLNDNLSQSHGISEMERI